MGVCEMLLVALVTLKVSGAIGWPWVVILAPALPMLMSWVVWILVSRR